MGEPSSIQARIAALNLGQVGRNPLDGRPSNASSGAATNPTGTGDGGPGQPVSIPSLATNGIRSAGSVGKPPRPPPPSRPPIPRAATAGTPSITTNGIGNEPAGPNPQLPVRPTASHVVSDDHPEARPQLPTRPPSTPSGPAPPYAPALPVRRPSAPLNRLASNESLASTQSAVSARSSNPVGSPPPRTPGSHSFHNANNRRTSSSNSHKPAPQPRVLAPVYDPSTLPPLPPKRASTGADAQANGLRPGVSSARSSGSVAGSSPNASNDRLSIHASPGLDARRLSGQSVASSIASSPRVPQRSSGENVNVLADRHRDEGVPPMLPRRSPTAPSNHEQNPSLPTRPNARTNSDFSDPMAGRRKLPPTTIPSVKPVDRANGLGINAPRPSPGSAPPVPASTRPDLSAIMSTKPSSSATSTPVSRRPGSSTGSCLHCRDFTAADEHATRFPRQQVPSLDWLAEQLTRPFDSATDKARAIFTWLHHNIDYDVVAFFNNRVKSQTPEQTLRSGLAVCEGYAGLFAVLATKAGLEAFVASGHGKGIGWQDLKAGDAVPPESTNHAWNAVRLDTGNWHLIDPCWGAGNVSGAGQPYTRKFNPLVFNSDPIVFGLRHFPSNSAHFYRSDGARPSWADYMMGPDGPGADVQEFNGVAEFEGLASHLIVPRKRQINISTSDRTTRLHFQMQRVCAHWDARRHNAEPGGDYQYILLLCNAPGNGNWFQLETNADAQGRATPAGDLQVWWADVPVSEMLQSGRFDGIMLACVDPFDGRSGRGLSARELRDGKGRKAMGFRGVAKWDVTWS